VWSTDGSGIAFGTSDTGSAFEGRLSPSRPKLATWSLLDVGSGVRRKIATISGAWFMPVSWDRATDAASAIEYGRDGPSTTSRLFYVWDPQHVPGKASLKQLPASIEPFSVHSDTSAHAVLGLEPYQCGQSTCRNLWIWDPTDPTAAVTRRIPGRVLNSATFRPGSLSIFAMLGRLIGDDGPTALVELGPPSSSMLREVYTPLRSSFVFRADGSAIVLGSYNFTDGRGLIVDPDTGASTSFTVSSVEDVIAGIGSGPPRRVAVPSGAPAASPSPTSLSAGFATVEEAAAAVERALQGDPQLLYRLVRPAGWYAQWYEQGKTDPMSLGEAASWITLYPEARRIIVDSGIFPTDAQHPIGEAYVRSQWTDFGGYPEQKADIMLGQVGGRWFWTSVLLYRPPPIGAGPDTFNGYATLREVTDTTLSVQFRAIGSRCCSDPSWNVRYVTLRRDRTTWMRAGGVVVPTFEATGAVVGSDVWVQFAPSTLAADGTYRLSDFAKMYP
jgi:hypothetical protein